MSAAVIDFHGKVVCFVLNTALTLSTLPIAHVIYQQRTVITLERMKRRRVVIIYYSYFLARYYYYFAHLV